MLNVSSGKGSFTASMAAAPQRALTYSTSWPDFWHTADITLTPSAEISGPIPSPANTAIFNFIVLRILLLIIYLRFQLIEHLDGRLDGSFCLVCIQRMGADSLSVKIPGNYGMNKSIGAATWRNVDHIVCEPWERALQNLLVDMAHTTDKRIILAVTAGIGFINLTFHLNLQRGSRLQAVGVGHKVAHQLDLLICRIMFEDIGNDIGQIVLRYHFLFVC